MRHAPTVELNPRQHVPVEEFEQNTRHILQHALDMGYSPIAIAPPPHDAEAWARFRLQANEGVMIKDRDNANTGQYV